MTEEKETYEVAKTDQPSLGLMQQGVSLFFDIARFEHAQRVAMMLSKSSMVPEQFRASGGEGTANCLIALNLAERMRVDPFMLMQNMYIVHGRPGIEAKLAIALVNGNGRFEPLQYEFKGEGENRQCRAYAKELKVSKTLYGPWVTWKMAEAEGWTKDKQTKSGATIKSKWKTMGDLMFTYRSAMFFARVYDPGSLLGLQTKEELEQIVIDVTPKKTIALDPEPGHKPDYTATELKEEKTEGKDKTETRGTPEDSGKLAFRKEWLHLRPVSYEAFVKNPQNTARIEGACKQWSDIAKEMQEKWAKLCPKDPWPLLSVEEKPHIESEEKKQGIIETDVDPEFDKFQSQVTTFLDEGVPESDLKPIFAFFRIEKLNDLPADKRKAFLSQLDVRLQKLK